MTMAISVGKTIALVDDEDYPLLSRHKWWPCRGPNATYAQTTFEGSRKPRTTLTMQRLIIDGFRKCVIDHRNRDGLDNRKSNLRLVSKGANYLNRKISKVGETSRYRGVYWVKRRSIWCARVFKNRRAFYRGDFETEIDAAKAYDNAVIRAFGNVALTNFGGNPNA